MAEVKMICMEALERRCSSGDAGRLDFRRDVHEGQIFVEDGLIAHAQLAGLEGIPALFRLFDWGDAEPTWHPGVRADQATLHLPLDEATVMYAEHLRDRAELAAREQEKVNEVLYAPELLADQVGGLESILKCYNITLECSEKALLSEGFTFADAAKNSYVIGSGDECDVILRHPSVEPLHCGVILEKGSVHVWDLGAHSGIKLNGGAISQGILKVGDVMTLGAVDLNVRFKLRRPSIKTPVTAATPAPAVPEKKAGPPPKEIPKGAITYDKVSKSLKDSGKAKPFLAKLGSLFGPKSRK